MGAANLGIEPKFNLRQINYLTNKPPTMASQA